MIGSKQSQYKLILAHFANGNPLQYSSPGMAEPGGLPSMGSHRVGHDWSDLAAAAATEKEFKYNLAESQVKLYIFSLKFRPKQRDLHHYSMGLQ